MNRTDFKKILKDSVSFGLLALGIYNLLIFVRYFRSGHDTSVIPPKAELLLADVLIVLSVTVIAAVLVIIIRRLRKK